jgi:F0F1-type ATP synthase membrane subunit a
LKSILVSIGIIIIAMIGAGFIAGAVGSSFFGETALKEVIGVPQPEVHLAPQQVLSSHAGESIHGGNQFLLTNTILSSIVSTTILALLFVFGSSRMKVIPGRLQGLLETIIEGLMGFITSVIGEEKSRAVFPMIATFFLFVLFNAWFGLIPVYQSLGYTKWESVTFSQLNKSTHFQDGDHITIKELEHEFNLHHSRITIIDDVILSKKSLTVEANRFEGNSRHAIKQAGGSTELVTPGLSATLLRPAGTDLNMPIALAIISFLFVEGLALKYLSFSYFGKFFRFQNLLRGKIGMGLIDLFVGILELISEFVRLLSFTFRLFGNMTAGEILLAVSAFLISFILTIPFYGLELLVGFVQALILAGLTLVFVSIAVTPHEHEEEH